METDNFDFDLEKNEIMNTLFKDPSTFNEGDEVKDYAEEFSTNIENILGELDMLNETENVSAPTAESGEDFATMFDLDNFLQDDLKDGNDVSNLFQDAQVLRDDFINLQNDLRQVHVDIPEIDVSNVVCKSFVGCRINLQHCNQYMKNSSMHTHQKFPALFIRLKNPDLSILLFTTGNVVITGARLYEDACMAVQKLVGLLVKLRYNAVVGPVKIENFVAKVCMGFPIKLSELQSCILHKRYCDQQNGRFPCINYRIFVIEPKVTVRIFGNGIFLIQSAKSMVTLRKSVELMVPVLHQFRNRTDIPTDATKLLPLFDHVGQYPVFEVNDSFNHPFTVKGSTRSVLVKTEIFDEFDTCCWIDRFSKKGEKYVSASVETKLAFEDEDQVKKKISEKLLSSNLQFEKKKLGFYVRTENDCPFSKIYVDVSEMLNDVVNYAKSLSKDETTMFYFILTEQNINKHFLVSVKDRQVKQVTPFACDQNNTWITSMIEKDWTNYVLIRLWYLATSNVIPRISPNLKDFVLHFAFFSKQERLQTLQIVPISFAPRIDEDKNEQKILLKFQKI